MTQQNGSKTGKPVTVGVIGAGDIARTAHLPVLQAMAEANPVWVADVDAGRSAAMGKAAKLPHYVLPKDAHVLDLPAADVVLLAIPYGARMPFYRHYQGRQTALYVEKPFARTASEHELICSMYAPQMLASGLMMRSWSSNLMAQELVASHMFGALRVARFSHGRPGLVTHGRYYLDPKKGGGGMVSEFGIHGIDSLLHLTQAQMATVESVRTIWEGSLDLHTHAELGLQLPDGTTARCEITVSGIEDLVEGVELEFDDAIINYLLPGQGYALHGDKVDLQIAVRPKRMGGAYHLSPRDAGAFPTTKFQMFHHFWNRFLEGIRNGEANYTSAKEAQLTTWVIDEITRERNQKLEVA